MAAPCKPHTTCRQDSCCHSSRPIIHIQLIESFTYTLVVKSTMTGHDEDYALHKAGDTWGD
ncbi:MAG TPA: hypothetical protein VNI77_04550 [Nitrososphaera sp.]|nr:hypothetical protein [Nitrososphaera sp.]